MVSARDLRMKLPGNSLERINPETSILLALLGRPIRPTSMLQQQSRSQTPAASRAPPTPKTSKPDRVKLENLVRELQDTERRYLRRITTLKTEYADPLRRFAKNPETMIIPLYDAKVMFANIDSLVNAAEAFQKDIEAVDLTGRVVGRGIGDICLRHVSPRESGLGDEILIRFSALRADEGSHHV